MSATPDPAWGVPGSTWEEVITRYVRHRQVETWRGRTHDLRGNELPNHLEPDAADRLLRSLVDKARTAVAGGTLPQRAHPLAADALNSLLKALGCAGKPVTKCPEWLVHLRKAALLNRDGYACVHCGRTAWGVFAESGRTLRFEMDHRIARSRLTDCDDFDLDNIVSACRSCNVIKGQMDREAFEAELLSLARGVVAKHSANRLS